MIFLISKNGVSLTKSSSTWSCPDNLTEKPSANNVPNARLSAVDQSIPLSFSID